MNEKIKEIALQAGGSFYPDVNSMQLEKFAELIVRECADLCVDNVVDEICGGTRLSAKIKKHFGIEE